jgi:hypothetical protein
MEVVKTKNGASERILGLIHTFKRTWTITVQTRKAKLSVLKVTILKVI